MWENERERESVREEAERRKKEAVYRQKQKTEDDVVVVEETLEESSEPMNGAQWQVVPTCFRAMGAIHTHTHAGATA